MTPTGNGFTADLLDGLATWIAANVTGVTYKPAAAYTAAETGISLGSSPDKPDALITIDAYPVDENAHLPYDIHGVQVRTRHTAKRQLDSLADAVFDLLHGATHIDLATGVHVTFCQRRSSAPLGNDSNARPERTDNYYLHVTRESPNRGWI